MSNEILTTKIMPVMKIDEMVATFDEYQKLREKLEREGDFIEFSTSQGKKKAPTKQWRVKLERFFGLSVEIIKDWDTKEDDNSITYHKRARVTHLGSGLFHEATGACNTKEKERDMAKRYHNAESHAETRAKNRTVLEFVGFGEVSAEELTEVNKEENGNKKVNPATPKQINYIKEKMIGSSKSTLKEKQEWNKLIDDGIGFEEAYEKLSWWMGDIKKGIIGERKKREEAEKKGEAINNPKEEINPNLEKIVITKDDFTTLEAMAIDAQLETWGDIILEGCKIPYKDAHIFKPGMGEEEAKKELTANPEKYLILVNYLKKKSK